MKFRARFLVIFNWIVVMVGLLIPLVLFLNRFLIPDVSYDSINYHLFLGKSGLDFQNNQCEFFPTGIHNFSPILEIPGYILMRIFGYRLGSITSLIFLYLSIVVLYKIFRLYQPQYKIFNNWWWGLIFGSAFLSFEAFLQLAIYFVDIQVAFFSLLGCYLLFKYEKTKNIRDLGWSALTMSVLLLGKMTAGYMLPAYFSYLLLVLISDKNLNRKQVIIRLILSILLVISLSVPWWMENYKKTGNPVFPYYNTIFKSSYYPPVNISQSESGGETTSEKIWWGIVSINDPKRLGQAHDLFHDYKINVYFILSGLILIWSLIRKDKDLLKLVIWYLITFEIWAWVFGYLRYGIFLEFLGGIILLIWLTKLNGSGRYLIIIPILGGLLLQNKRVVNLSLAYDLSFRPGYFYNRLSYPRELKNLGINKIKINQEWLNKYHPQIFLNCVAAEMSYAVLSDFSNLPVLNIDREFYSGMTDNQFYKDKSRQLMRNYIDSETVSFVAIATSQGLNTTYEQCLKNLEYRKFQILDEVEVDFLGYQNQKLKIIFGEFNW